MTEKVKNLLSMIISAVGMVALVLTTVFCLVTPESIRKSPDSLPTDVATGTDVAVSANPLIKWGGAVDADVLAALLAKVGNLEASNSTTEKHMGEINGGNPVTVKLFDTVSTTTNNINLLTAKYWQPVYRTGNILTLWMVEPYTTAQFDPSTNVYSNSSIHTLMNNTYTTLDTTFNLNTKNFVATPAQLPVPWQTGLPQLDTTKYPTSGSGYDAQNNLMNDGLENDKLWLPSYAEVFNNTTSTWTYDSSSTRVRNGLWQTNNRDRTYANNSTYAWLRSAYSYPNITYVCKVRYDGYNNSGSVNFTFGVRPALHLNLSSLASAANLKGDVISGSIIKEGGAVDAATLSTLLDKMGGLEPEGSIITKDLTEINGGTPLTLKLFDTVADTTNALDKLTASYWQVVYRTGNVLTLWMTAPYTTAQFNDSESKGDDYASSDIQKLMVSTYDTLNTTFNLNTKNFVATPAQLPVPWQTNSTYQPDSTKFRDFEGQNNLMDGGLESDRLWLPSWAEVFNNDPNTSSYDGTASIWKTTQATRAFTNSTASYAWLRSAVSNGTYACYVRNDDGAYGAYYVNFTGGVRPALHLNLEELSKLEMIVQAQPTEGGTVTGGGRVTPGESVTLTATPTPPYTFRGWYENGITLLSTETTYTFTPTRSMNIVGLFYAAGGYEAEAISTDPAMGSAALKSVKGTTAIFVAVPNPGYTFTGWFTAATGGSAVSTANPYTVNMTSDTTLYARFTLSSVSNLLLFAPSTGGETRIVSGTGNLNSEIIIVAVPYVGYTFGGWINVATGATISNEPTYKFTITGALTLRANFVVQTFTASSLSINHAADLVKLANLVNSGQTLSGVTVTLETDVDIGALSREWESIGTASTKFAGIFQGNGHKITNSGTSNLNLFATGTTAQVYNLQLGEKVIAGATIQNNGLLPVAPEPDDWATINPGGR